MTDVIELTELFGPCVYLDPVDDIEGFDPCDDGAGEDAAEDPKSRRVDENSLDGRRREDEYYKVCQHVAPLGYVL